MSPAVPSLMAGEIAEIPLAAERLLRGQGGAIARLGQSLRERRFTHAVVAGRGSSGHAGTHLRHLIETRLGLSAAPASPSVVSRYRAGQQLAGALWILISQSGRSPDLIAAAEQASAAGAETIALVNDPHSPAARACTHVLDIAAGPERAVAASKTVTNTLLAGSALIAALAGDDDLAKALPGAPERLAAALALDWSAWARAVAAAPAGYVVGRGPTLGPAREAALKVAEMLGVPVLAYSAAEVLHGPRAAIGPAHPVLGLSAGDEVAGSIETALATLAGAGAPVFAAFGPNPALPGLPFGHPVLDAIAVLVPVYRALEAEAARRGRAIDAPPGLAKITETL